MIAYRDGASILVCDAFAATHPDRGGDEDDFKAVSAAREAA